MRIKITMEMSGNEFLNLLRRVPKPVAQQMLASTMVVRDRFEDMGKTACLFDSAKQLIEQKKR